MGIAPSRKQPGSRVGRGRLKVYLGAAAGAGKTFAMLRLAHALLDHGRDVVVAYVETYGRPRTVELMQGLELLPRKRVEHRGATLEDMDLDAVLERRPEVALVDELAHTNAPGLRHAKRWQDVEELREGGIDVITTVNVQHLESVEDLVERFSGVRVRETLPDRVLDGADVVRFIDITPEALRRRMREGDVYRSDKVEAALAHFFRPRNLAALREIGLRMVADSIARSWNGARSAEDVLVAVACRDTSEGLMRRGARLARRRGGACHVVTVQTAPGRAVDPGRFRDLAAELGCSFTLLEGRDVAGAVIREAHRVRAAHVVMGELSGTSRLEGLRHHIADRIIDGLPDADVHVIAEAPRRRAHPAWRSRDAGDRRPDPEALLEDLAANEGREPILRVYLGHTHACGTTTAMLEEARLRAARGADVVVAACRVEGDPRGALAGLEVLGGPAGGTGELALDVESVLARKPAVVCVDDLAGPASQGGRTIDAVSRLLQAGITVLGTLHLSSARDRPVRDRLLGMVDELEVIDLPPDELRERAGQGGAPGPEPQPAVLATLREAALRMAADHSDRRVVGDLRRAGAGSAEIRSRVVLCLPPRLGLEPRIRDAARYAHAHDATFAVVSVVPDGRSAADETGLDSLAAVTREFDGEFHCLQGEVLTSTLAGFIRESLATEVIIGHRRARWRPWDATSQLIRLLHGVDIHVLRR